MTTEELFIQLRKYLYTEYSISPDKVSKSTSLLHDLEIYGDDIDEFFGKLIRDFKINVKELTLSRYFVGDEPFDFLSPAMRLFKQEKVVNKPTVTIKDVLEFIETGVLK